MVQRARWPLPETVNPATRRYFCVPVPDDPAYISAFRGAVYKLAKPYAWANDEAHTAIDVGAVMMECWDAITEVGSCMFDIRIDPNDPCMLQKTLNGVDWIDVGSFNPCAAAAASDAIQDGIADGTIGVPGQQPPGGTIPEADCKVYEVELRGADKWLCPVPVSAGFTILVTNASGGWGDGALLWWCPDGAGYVLGTCNESLRIHRPEDPLPTAYHGQIVGELGNGIAWFDPLTATYEVPFGQTETHFTLQMNDDPISDNLGSVRFTVEVCRVAAPCELTDTMPSGVTLTKLDDYSWHVNVHTANVQAGGIWFYQCYLSAGDEAQQICCIKYAIYNMTGYSDAPETTNNGARTDCFDARSAAPRPLDPGDGWQTWYNGAGFPDLQSHVIDVRSGTAFEFDVMLTDRL